jgi:ABC transporter, phosphonate, periplasmic substrate-binding protein
MPASVQGTLRAIVVERLDRLAPGWVEVPASDDRDAIRRLVEARDGVDGALSRYVYSAPNDLVGDGRKELEADRPGTLRETRIVDTTDRPAPELSTVYYGCVMARSDGGINRLEDLQGRSFAFSDETSTSGHIFARALLQRRGITLGHVLFAGGHPNVVQAVYDGKVAGGATFYSPPSAVNERDGTLVADARFLIVKNMQSAEERASYLEQVRVLALTEAVWQRFAASLDRFLATPDGQSAYYDLVAGVAAAPCRDDGFDGFRSALRSSGVSAVSLLEAAEERLRRQRGGGGGGS